MIAVAFITDRGDRYLPDCQETFRRNVDADLDAYRVFDDREHLLGMADNVNKAWAWAADIGADYLLHIEEDFVFPAPVRVGCLQAILDADDKLAQVVLKRQAWSPEEHAAGGIVECKPDEYVERTACGHVWTEHTRIFSLNPCLIPRRVFELGWPKGNEAEFTEQCVDRGLRFAFYGGKFDKPLVIHTGLRRSAGWRL